MKKAPRFIHDAAHPRVAEKIAKALGLSTTEEFKKLLSDKGPGISKLYNHVFWDYPIEQADVDHIGTG